MTLPKTSVHSNPSPALTNIEQDSWEKLASALDLDKNRSTNVGFKTMIMASRTTTGADARTVVLRKVDAPQKYVWFHTDVRAEKVMQLEAFPDSTLLFWDDKEQIQLRLLVETHMHTKDYVADEHWQTLGFGSRKSYLSEYKPGSEQPGPYPGFPTHLGAGLPSAEESEAGRNNFAVIECRVLAMEYLHLSRDGQVRARFQYEPDSKMVWLAP